MSAEAIKILLATKVGQGIRDSDFSWADEGEVVYFGWTCDRDANNPNPDGGCGCGRAMSGALSGKGTTTFCVALWPRSRAEFIDYVMGAHQEAGWLQGMDADGVAGLREDAEQILEIAAKFPLGAVLEKRRNSIQMRRPKCQPVTQRQR